MQSARPILQRTILAAQDYLDAGAGGDQGAASPLPAPSGACAPLGTRSCRERSALRMDIAPDTCRLNDSLLYKRQALCGHFWSRFTA